MQHIKRAYFSMSKKSKLKFVLLALKMSDSYTEHQEVIREAKVVKWYIRKYSPVHRYLKTKHRRRDVRIGQGCKEGPEEGSSERLEYPS